MSTLSTYSENFEGFQASLSKITANSSQEDNSDELEFQEYAKQCIKRDKPILTSIYSHFINENHPYKKHLSLLSKKETEFTTPAFNIKENENYKIKLFLKKEENQETEKEIISDFILAQLSKGGSLYNHYHNKDSARYKPSEKETLDFLESFRIDAQYGYENAWKMLIHEENLKQIKPKDEKQKISLEEIKKIKK